ncbi:glutamate formimidoyltransferase [candidate division KSB1 bacterium]|nr:glutamate formimidoyltransferase [candidate division KSB1 bacterium]
MKIVECVPNFSEGRKKENIQAIASVIEEVPEVKLLNVDSGYAANRTVMTFIGPPDAVEEAAFLAIQKALALINMSNHKGVHPRLGAVDVVPFIPVVGLTMQECIAIARQLGKRVAKKLDVPVYLYGNAALKDERKNLSEIRRGEYEGLEEKIRNPVWQPDFGEAKFNAKSGAICIGARKFLIAFNVNLNTKDKSIANDIAMAVRTSGRPVLDENHNPLVDETGNTITEPGLLKACQAIGWYIDDFKTAQVSMNLTDFELTPIHVAFEIIVSEGQKRGVRVIGSELVGMLPLEALLEAGRYYFEKQGKSAGQPEQELVEMAVKSLGLDQLKKFIPEDRIIDYQIREPFAYFSLQSLKKFLDELSLSQPDPSGGQVIALLSGLGAALGAKIANSSMDKSILDNKDVEQLSEAAIILHELKRLALICLDDETSILDTVDQAFQLPESNVIQAENKAKELEKARKKAVKLGLQIASLAFESLKLLEQMIQHSSKISSGDIAIGVHCADAAVHGTVYHVIRYLVETDDKDFVSGIKKEIATLVKQSNHIKAQAIKKINEKME